MSLSKLRGSSRLLLTVQDSLKKTETQISPCSVLQDVRHVHLELGSRYSRTIPAFHRQQLGSYVQCRGLFKKSGENIDEESGLPLHHPEKGTLVYTGRMSSVVRNLKILSLSTSLISGGCQPFLLGAANPVQAKILSSMCMVVFCTPLFLHFVTKKYVTDIYFNEATKTFTLAKKTFFVRRKEVQYTADDAKVSLDGGMFVTHKVKGVSYFIEYTDFRSKEIYLHMVGYDKPIDYGIPDPNKHLKAKKKFGLFEDEDNEKKPGAASIPWRSSMTILDDDDDDTVQKANTKKQGK